MDAMRNEVDSYRISTRLKLFYGSGQAVNAILDAAINTFLLFYLTAVCGMSGSAAGAVFLVSLGVDGLLDPFIGRLSDRWTSRWGRRLPFMVVALPPMMLASVLLFALPVGLSGATMFAYVLILNLVLRVGLSIFALPHSALNAEITDDYSERTVLSTYRALFLVVGFAMVLVPAFSLIFTGSDGLQVRSSYPKLGMWVAALVAVFGASCTVGIAKDLLRLPSPPPPSEGSDQAGFLSEILQLFRNPSFVRLFTAAVLVLAGQGMASALGLHVYRYFWKVPNSLIQLPLLVMPVGMLVGTVAAGLLMKHIEKREGVIWAVIAVAAYPALIVALALLDIVTPGSTTAIILVVVNGAVFGGCGAICFVCFYSMIADAVDEHDLRFGVRREALYAAALMIGSKAATGLGAFVAGLGLQLVGFSAAAKAGSTTIISGSTATGIGLLWGPGATIVVLAALPMLRRYGIDRNRHAEILAELQVRRTRPGGGDGAVPAGTSLSTGLQGEPRIA